MKRIISIVLSMCTMLSLSTTSIAASDMPTKLSGVPATVNENFSDAPIELQKQILADDELTSAAQYAYMDIDTADDELKDDILEARNTIIYSQDWIADEYSLIDENNNIVNIPTFSYLFPDWNLPEERVSEETISEMMVLDGIMPYSSITWFNGEAPVPKAVEGKLAPIFAGGRFTGRNDWGPEVYISGLTGCNTCNLGYSKLEGYTSVDLCWKTRIPSGSTYKLEPRFVTYNTYYCVRVSTYDNAGSGWFKVGYPDV